MYVELQPYRASGRQVVKWGLGLGLGLTAWCSSQERNVIRLSIRKKKIDRGRNQGNLMQFSMKRLDGSIYILLSPRDRNRKGE